MFKDSCSFKKADDRTRTDNLLITNQLLCQLSHIGINDPDGNRTRVTAVKGRCLNRLTMEPQYLFSYEKTPRVGLEPTTTRLTAECSTIELSRNIYLTIVVDFFLSATFNILSHFHRFVNNFFNFFFACTLKTAHKLFIQTYYHFLP